MRTSISALTLLLLGLSVVKTADAKPIFDMSGKVALLDGILSNDTRVTIGIDLDRNGKLNTFEVVDVNVFADGSYGFSYEPKPDLSDIEFGLYVADLLVEYEARGFEAVLDDGPLPIVARYERFGYSTIVKRFTTLTDLLTLDITLVPLAPVHCADDVCMAPDGSVRISGFPGGTGIDRIFSRAFDPSADQSKFPGSFSDSANNLLLSSGFVEVDLRNATGGGIPQLASPISVRFRTDPRSWSSLRDLEEDSSRIEVPMYSFNETSGEWVSEAAGELQTSDGSPIDERDFASIRDGSYEEPVFVSFETSHFSTFNCDAPVTERGCVQGRLVTVEGEAVVGAQVSVDGVSYTGSAGMVFTGSDGYFAADVMKSEEEGQDVDANGRRGETFQARVTVSGAVGVFVGEAFDTPVTVGSVGGSRSCRAPNCDDCVDLGDIEGEFELPRACEVTVNVTFSGRHLAGSGGPLEEGDAVASARVTGELSGGPSLPLDDAICEGSPCNTGRANEDGTTTFVVPVVGDEPTLSIKADYSTEDGDTFHLYTGSVSVSGCARGDASVSGEVELELEHASLGDLGVFIESLGSGPQVPNGSGGTGGEAGIPELDEPSIGTPKSPSCGCRMPGAERSSSGGLVAGLFVGLLALRRRSVQRQLRIRATASSRRGGAMGTSSSSRKSSLS